MDTLENIFVPYKIAVQLKEIGFDEGCISFYYEDNKSLTIATNLKENQKKDLLLVRSDIPIIKYNLIGYVSAPTWEQVFKWFRDKGYESNVRTYFGFYYGTIGESEDIQLEQEKTYRQAQEQLILKLIEIYKNGNAR